MKTQLTLCATTSDHVIVLLNEKGAVNNASKIDDFPNVWTLDLDLKWV